MPLYSFKCDDCGSIHDVFLSIMNRHDSPECCGKRTRRIIGNHSIIGDIKPYWDENISDKPVYVKSRNHKKKLLKEHGLYEIYGKNWK